MGSALKRPRKISHKIFPA